MMNAKNLVKLSLLTAISLIIFVIETKIPNLIPIPGVKLGLANIVTVWAIYSCRPHETALMIFARIVFGAVFCGTVLSFIYSISGAAMCFAGSYLAKRIIPDTELWLTSVVGAIFHQLGQITAARVLLGTSAIWIYLPILIVSGIVSGAFCGIAAQNLYKKLHMLH